MSFGSSVRTIKGMQRLIMSNLLEWKQSGSPQPLVLTGARQVGKSHLIERELAGHFENLLTLNFEKRPELITLFAGELSPAVLLPRIEALARQTITSGKTLLFLDEIQTCPQALLSLRYFSEEMPSLHVVAAGSLLDFALAKVPFPVGRVTFRHLQPVSFEEFLLNSNNNKLLEQILNHDGRQTFHEALHKQALDLLVQYLCLGGMPKVLNTYLQTGSYTQSAELQNDLLEAYRNDFPKYVKRDRELEHVALVFSTAPRLVGRQFKWAQIHREIKTKYLRKALDLLTQASVISKVRKAMGLPLDHLPEEERFKLLFLDVGLMQRACRLDMAEWITNPVSLINAGCVAEQFAGQEIMAASSFRKENCYYWERDKKGSTAEVDYVLAVGNQMLPIEVKSGSVGTLKSMQLFLSSHPEVKFGIKSSLDNFCHAGKIRSIPLYALGAWLRHGKIRA